MILPSRNTRGQGTIDYVLIAVLLGLAAVFAFKLLGTGERL